MKKLAIVVGHNQRAQGAVRADTGETEFSWNLRLSEMIEILAKNEFPGIKVKTFLRQDMRSYKKELTRVYAEVDDWDATASCELHFNSHHNPNATGTETLTSGSPASMRFAEAAQEGMLEALGLKDRGEKIVRKGRGSASLMTGKCPAILIEPYFGSSTKGLRATDEPAEMRALARAILRAFVDSF